MNRSIKDFVTPTHRLLALGEPTHLEPAFPWVRNDLFADAVSLGFRSIALETDRVAALAVDDYVQGGAGDLDEVMAVGFSHGFGALEPNRHLVAWMRAYNEGRPPRERLSFHGVDASTEPLHAPSPRAYLEAARDHLGRELDLASLAGDDELWGRAEAVLDHAMSPGATPGAGRLRLLADDLVTALHDAVPAARDRRAWLAARTRLQAGIALLRYHRHAAEPGDMGERQGRLLGARDVIIAENILDIRAIEGARGPTMLFAANAHLQRDRCRWSGHGITSEWTSAGAIVAAVVGEEYAFIAGALGRSEAKGLAAPAPGTFEAALGEGAWGLFEPDGLTGEARADHVPGQGYFPLDRETLDGCDGVLYIPDASAVG
ncbi:erythromycin esterase [Actinorhabdospora filicis]|uniref:Erythromycin esterase n=1 Tax=Actinorhabdospora filicis TaxID=1785913 RepID=A0A9W6SHT0_9ACTN|nr:erythromycin esterase family protein [Actinorhabdospora filicis]GLZ75736.1 erythromycin esterase [Actinorhabdospora filicis]